MVKHDEPEKQEVGNPIADEEVDEGPMDEGEDPELAEIDDEGFEDEKEFSAVNDALDNISDALDKLEEQNDQLNEQLRSILEASQRMKSKRGNQNAPEDPSPA